MKIVIIGAGMAGLALGIYLRAYGMEVSLHERAIGETAGGHAFLMHREGLTILEELKRLKNIELPIPGMQVEKFSLKTPDGQSLQELDLGSWQCIKRADLRRFLLSLLDLEVHTGHNFSHFLYEGQRATAAVFTDGSMAYGDVFVGADGGHSKVRDAVFGKVRFRPGLVKEVVGLAQAPELALAYAGIFSKFQKAEIGLAFGMIPTSATTLVWYLQYDPSNGEYAATTPEALRAFCEEQMRDFPDLVHLVLQANDFHQTYVWNTRDFDLLPAFHSANVVLIGDAAHLALPFTSAGTTNAMLDARLLAALLQQSMQETHGKTPDLEAVFNTLYQQRAAELLEHLEFGRKLRDVFLNPNAALTEKAALPLITVK